MLLLWIPLRQRPGLGTLCNVVLVGLAIDATLAVLPRGRTRCPGAAVLAGVLLNGVATGAYIGAGWARAPGRADHRLRRPRSLAAAGAHLHRGHGAAVGWLLGGTVGVGTLLYALAIGPLMHRTVPALQVRSARPGDRAAAVATG